MGVHGLKDVNCAIHKGAPLLSISACTKASSTLVIFFIKKSCYKYYFELKQWKKRLKGRQCSQSFLIKTYVSFLRAKVVHHYSNSIHDRSVIDSFSNWCFSYLVLVMSVVQTILSFHKNSAEVKIEFKESTMQGHNSANNFFQFYVRKQ